MGDATITIQQGRAFNLFFDVFVLPYRWRQTSISGIVATYMGSFEFKLLAGAATVAYSVTRAFILFLG